MKSERKMDDILNEIMVNVNVMYIFLCNLITYIIIDLIENGGKKKTYILKWWKRLISAVSAIGIGYVMIRMYADEPFIKRQIFYGFFIQFLTWDYVFKSLIEQIKNKFSNGKEKELSE